MHPLGSRLRDVPRASSATVAVIRRHTAARGGIARRRQRRRRCARAQGAGLPVAWVNRNWRVAPRCVPNHWACIIGEYPLNVSGGETRGTPMRYLMSIVAAYLVAGCSILENDVERGYERSTLGPYPATYTTADIRMVTVRPHPSKPGLQVECAEPSPDVAKALASAVQLSANVS